MPTTVSLNAEQRQQVLSANQQQAQAVLAAAQAGVINANQFVFFAAFDGTNNDRAHPERSGDPYTTNADELEAQVELAAGTNSNVVARYYPGVQQSLNPATWLLPVNQQVSSTAEKAYSDFAAQASAWLRDPDHADGSVTVALTSFSRGDASAAIFSQLLYERGLIDPDTQQILIAPGQVGVSAGVIFDPVTTGVSGNLAFAPNVRNIVDIKSWNEYRSLFRATDYSSQPGVTTIGMYGNHVDIGGGYDRGIGALSLQAATDFFKRSGLAIENVQVSRAFDASAPINVHDEAFFPNGLVQWTPDYVTTTPSGDTSFFSLDTTGPNARLDNASATVAAATTSAQNGVTTQTLNLYNGSVITMTMPAESHSLRVKQVSPVSSSGLQREVVRDFDRLTYPATLADAIVSTRSVFDDQQIIFGRALVDMDVMKIDVASATSTFVAMEATNGAGFSAIATGGVGFDTYRTIGRPSHVTIQDVDGLGRVIRGSTPLALGIKASDGVWTLAGTTFTANGSDLEVTFADGTDRITIRDYNFAQAQMAGYEGLRLVDQPTFPDTVVRTFAGDKQDYDADPNQAGIQAIDDGFGNPVRADGTDGRPDIEQDDRADVFLGSAAGDVEFFDTQGGDDVVYGDGLQSSDAGGRDVIVTGEGRDYVLAGGGNDWVEGGEGADILSGNTGDDVIYADTSDEQTLTLPQAIAGGETAPAVAGTGDLVSVDTGRDTIIGTSTADALLGGADEDVIVGGGGNDNIFGDGSLGSASQGWTMTRVETQNADGGTTYRVDFVGATVTLGVAHAADVIFAGAGDDWVFAGAGDDYVEGGNGADVIIGEAGSDILLGGAGNDTIDGDSAEADAAGTSGDDYLDAGAGKDTLKGNKGNDILIGGEDDDILIGGEGDDFLWGGPGTDVLLGGAGKDTYVFYRGDGVEVIQDLPEDATGADASVLVLGPGIRREQVKFRTGSLMVDLGDGDEIHFDGWDTDDPLATRVLDSIVFADGEVMSYDDVLAQGFEIDGTDESDVIRGTAVSDRVDARGGDDFVIGGAGDDTILGGEGNDFLAGEGGDDTLEGGAGADRLEGGEGDDLLIGGEGADVLRGDFGNDILEGGDGDDDLEGAEGSDSLSGGAGSDRLAGGEGNDTLDGGTGSDELSGGAGSDTYLFARGDGVDVIREEALVAQGIGDGAGVDTIRFAARITAADVTFARRANGDLVIDYGTGDRVTIEGQYLGAVNAIERIEFGDGSALERAQLEALPIAPITGTSGDDVITGTEAGDRLVGLEGDDLLDGGAGNDILEGGPGADAYLVYVGMGADTIIDASPSEAEAGTLRVADGLDLDSLSARRRGDDLLVSIRGRQDSALMEDFYAEGAPAQNWQLAFADGTTSPIQDLIDRPDPNADFEALAAMADYKAGIASVWRALSHGTVTFPDHALLYSSWSQTQIWFRVDRFHPYQLINTVTARETVLGGYGVGGGRSFTALANPQVAFNVTPQSVAQESDAAEIHPVGVPTSSSTTQIFPVSPYQLFYGGANPSVTVVPSSINSYSVNAFAASTTPVGVVIGGSNPIGTFSVIRQNEVRIVEEIRARASDNVIFGAGGGDHVALIDAGGGNDTIYAGPEDFVYGNDGDDAILGGRLVYGGNGNDVLTGGASLHGGAGDDTLAGGAFMDGGAGNDTLIGADQANVFFFAADDAGAGKVLDGGGVSEGEFADWYYARLGVQFVAESEEFGGWWSVVGGTGFPLSQAMRRAETEHPGYQLLGQRDEHYRDGNGYPFDAFAVAYASLEDLRAELQFFSLSYRPEDIRYIQPLPQVPEIAADDYAALQPLYDAGLIPIDAVEFGEGVSIFDLTVMHSADGTALELYWGEDHRLSVALAQAGDSIGTGVEQFRFADGAIYWTADMLGLAQPFQVRATQGDDILVYTDGDDIGQGLGGDDQLFGQGGNDFLDGGAGNDYFLVEGRAFIVGGTGDDWIETRGEATVVAFNPGDGHDTVYAASGPLALSLGGGVGPADLFLRADGADVILSLASGDSIRLTRQLEADPYAWPPITAQLFGSVHTYDFNAVLVDLYSRPDPSVTFALDGVLQQYELAVSGADALGGTLAWLYATEGGTSALTEEEVRSVLADPGFGLAPQPIPVPAGVTLIGTDGNDILVGSSGADSLDGGLGRDTLSGGLGDDTYIVDRARDLVIEYPDEGNDTIRSSVSYVLPANVEDLVLTGTAATRGTGNELDNVITGSAAANVLDGGAGADVLIGGAGNDTYIVDDPGDVVVENAGEGTDTVKTWISYALTDDVEKLVLLGSAPLTGTGNALDNVLTGNAAASTLAGGAGDDTYVVSDPGTVIVEAPDAGIDTVKSSVSYVLPDNVEHLTLTGAEAIDGDGNALDNIITGNEASNFLDGGAGNDVLKGGAGADFLLGGEGDDTYFVDDPYDVVIEYPDEGIDTVKSSVDWRLGDNVENLTLTGTADLNGFGNELANVILGNKGANLLQGYGGADTLSGNLANDILQGGAGNDTLRGGGGNNVLDGGSGNDKLVGGDGNELFFGGSGNDTLTTGTGADIIAFNRGDGQDVVSASQGTDNTLSLGGGIRAEDLAFRKSGSNLIVQTGASEQVTFNGWYSATVDNRSVATLQIVSENIQTFDFIGLVDAFNAARLANPGLTTWAIAGALAANHLGEGSTQAIGGDLAFAVGRQRSLEGMSLDQARTALEDVNFGLQAQSITQVFAGGEGADNLVAGPEGAVLSGGGGDDALVGGDGNDFLAGDGGDDSIETGGGFNVIAYNAGGGTDTIFSDAGASNTISLGGGIGYDDLSLSRSGDDLVLNAGDDDRLVLKDWYGGKDDVANLQIILDASAAYDPNSQDPLRNGKVQTFDFRGLAQSFDQAYSGNPGLTSWSLTNALLQWHLSRSDDAALGGDLAYWYGRNGAVVGMSVQAAQQTIGAPNFGAEAQPLRVLDGLQEGLVRLG